MCRTVFIYVYGRNAHEVWETEVQSSVERAKRTVLRLTLNVRRRSVVCGTGISYMEKYKIFCMSLLKMKEIYNYAEPYDQVILTGIIGLYKICFEQSWKMMKEILEQHGFEQSETSSPKKILKIAYKAGMIEDEDTWLRALQARNNVADSYNQKIALEIVAEAKADYYDMFIK